MLSRRRTMAWIHRIGGMAVLGSNANRLSTSRGRAGGLSGGVLKGLRPVCTVDKVPAFF